LPTKLRYAAPSGSNLILGALAPSPDGGDDFVGVCGPGEGLWLGVVLVEKAVDGRLQLDDGSEHAALQPALGELGEEALDGIEPGSTRSA
jgi:hypothetical protein